MSVEAKRTHNLKNENKDNVFTIPTKGLVKEWKILNGNNVQLFLHNTELIVPRKNNNIFNFSEIRNYIRNLDDPIGIENTKLISLESLFFSYQLSAFEYYKSLKDEDFDNSLFTRDIPIIKVKVNGKYIPTLKIEETYYDRSKEPQTTILFS